MPTYVHKRTAAGAETVTDQLAGTAVRKAGPTGVVRACATADLLTTTFLLKGRQSGIEVIPNGSFANIIERLSNATDAKIDAQAFIFQAKVQPGEDLELTIVHAAAGSARVGVQTD